MPLIRETDRMRRGEDEGTTKERGENDKEREEDAPARFRERKKGGHLGGGLRMRAGLIRPMDAGLFRAVTINHK